MSSTGTEGDTIAAESSSTGLDDSTGSTGLDDSTGSTGLDDSTGSTGLDDSTTGVADSDGSTGAESSSSDGGSSSESGGEPAVNLIVNPGFEINSDWWFGFGIAGVTATSDKANTGLQSGLATGRTGNWQGPAINLLDLVTPGATYDFEGFVSITDGEEADVEMTVQQQCTGDDNPSYLTIERQAATGDSWVGLSGSLTVPTEEDCELTLFRLYFQGATIDDDVYLDIYIDDVSVTLQ